MPQKQMALHRKVAGPLKSVEFAEAGFAQGLATESNSGVRAIAGQKLDCSDVHSVAGGVELIVVKQSGAAVSRDGRTGSGNSFFASTRHGISFLKCPRCFV